MAPGYSTTQIGPVANFRVARHSLRTDGNDLFRANMELGIDRSDS